MNLKHLGLAVMFGLTTIVAHAQSLKVATGDPKGTYSRMFKELNERCGDAIPMSEVNSSGSMANVDALTGNQVNAAFVQTDVLVYRGGAEDLSGIKTLVALAPEEVHFIARADGKKEGGLFGVGGKHVTFNTINDLAGQSVGAAGGSVISAKVIAAQGGINYSVLTYPDNQSAINDLQAGKIDAVVAVGGSPLAVVAALDPGFKLLSVPKATATKLGGVYREARVSYPHMNAMGVPTIATDALFVTRDYKTAAYAAGLARVRQCLYSHLEDLKETTGTHPKWQLVSADNKGKWPFYSPYVK